MRDLVRSGAGQTVCR